MINIGYACITLGVPEIKYRTCRLNNASDEKLHEVIDNNLNSLKKAIEYNHANDIKLYRISSDIIPLASHPSFSYNWQDAFSDKLTEIGNLIKKYEIRVSMHPGQYTVINSINDDVIEKSVMDLRYHAEFLDLLGVDQRSKIVLHIGGVYGNKEEALSRFIDSYNKLDKIIKRRLIIENDDRNFNIEDVLYISEKESIPVVFDNLHHDINKPKSDKSDYEWIKLCSKTWKEKDGRQKIHYSQQDMSKSKGAHSLTINVKEFKNFKDSICGKEIDIMLEVKDKNLSAIKCILSIADKKNIFKIEKEWSRYKYYVLGKNPKGYKEIRELLKGKTSYPVEDFYRIIEDSINSKSIIGQEVNAAQHVYGYFKGIATDSEKKRFNKSLDKYLNEGTEVKNLKNLLYKLTQKYGVDYLIDSYYFVDVLN